MFESWVYRTLIAYGNVALPKTSHSIDVIKRHLESKVGRKVVIRETNIGLVAELASKKLKSWGEEQ